MPTLPQKNRNVKRPSGRFLRNCRAVLEAGYVINAKPGCVYVNDHAVDRELFETGNSVAIVALLDKHIGRHGMYFPAEG